MTAAPPPAAVATAQLVVVDGAGPPVREGRPLEAARLIAERLDRR